jgi:cytochrome c peroxidase
VPVLFNLAWQTKFHWDGEFNSLYDEAAQPINGHIELAESFNGVINKLEKYPEYRGAAPERFPEQFYQAWLYFESIGSIHRLYDLSQF